MVEQCIVLSDLYDQVVNGKVNELDLRRSLYLCTASKLVLIGHSAKHGKSHSGHHHFGYGHSSNKSHFGHEAYEAITDAGKQTSHRPDGICSM